MYVIRHGIIFSLYCRLRSGCLYTYSIYMLVSMCTHMCVYMYYICIHVCIYKWHLYIKIIDIVQYKPFVGQCGVPRWSCMVTPVGGFSDGCPTLVSFIFNIFGCGLYIYYSCFHMYCSSICIALWLGCQTICSNILSMHGQQLPAFKISMGWVRGDANIALACLLLHSFLSYISCTHIFINYNIRKWVVPCRIIIDYLFIDYISIWSINK